MKTIYKIGIAVLAVFLLLGCLGSNTNTNKSSTPSDNVQSAPEKAPELPLNVTENTLTKDQYGYYYVQGTAIANKDMTYAEIDAQFTDEDGAVVGSFLANTNNLKKGQTWKFKIIGPIDTSVRVAGANITDVKGY
ncbi:MAG: FxLYD domain-containing protein [Methanobacterium sp.]